MLMTMDARREQLLQTLERHYRAGSLWREPRRADDGTVRVEDCGGVTWIGVAVVSEDVEDDAFHRQLRELAGQYMPETHWRCPVELMPEPDCQHDVERLLRALRLEDAIDVYQTAA